MKYALMVLAVILQAPVQAVEWIDAVTLYSYTSEPRTLRFKDSCPHCDRYEWQLLSYEHGHVAASGQVPNQDHQPNGCASGEADQLSATLRMPRTGHYYVKLRGCTAVACSAWVTSMDAGTGLVDCQHRAWWMYGTVQPPGTPVFSTGE